MAFESWYLELLKDRVDLQRIPFTDRGSRLLVFHANRHFEFRLAERWYKRDRQLSAYRSRPPLIDEWHFTDAAGNPLDFELTTYPHRLDCRTPVGVFTLAFLDAETLLLTLPPGQHGLTFRVHVDGGQPDRRGGVLRLSGDIRRNVVYTTNARLLYNTITPCADACQQVTLRLEAAAGAVLLLNITPRLGFNRYLPAADTVLDAAARRWHDWFAAAPPVMAVYQPQYYYAWWVMRAGLISPRYYTTREALTPSKTHYVGIWQWDAYFHALAYRHVEPRLAQDQLRILLDHQRDDGMLPDAVHDEGTVTHLTFPVDADVTKPPLVAWTAWRLYEHDGDREFLAEIYEPLVRWNTWWFEQNDLDGDGLCEYQHPFSSGLDDSPLWDAGMPVTAPDLNTYLYLQMEALAQIATVLGEPQAAAQWTARADALVGRLFQHLWDPAAGLFWAKRHGVPVNVRTPFNLFPLLTGRLPPEVNRRLVAHLMDPHAFWPRYPVPTVALDDPLYDPLQMWRGPTWVNVNYLLTVGLQRAGYPDLAHALRQRTLDLLCQQPDICEYYHPETGAPPPKAAPTFGWSAALFIEMALQATRDQASESKTAAMP